MTAPSSVNGDAKNRTAAALPFETIQENYLSRYFKKGNRQDFDPGVNRYLETLLAQEFTSLTLQERQKTYEELHGVDDAVNETPELIDSNLKAMDVELDQISKKEAYLLSQEQNKQFATDPKFRLCFLRADCFDARKAAHRLVAFMEGKLHYFGEALLTKQIKFSDLDEDDRVCLRGGHMQILPSRDRAGRAIFCDMDMLKDTSYKRPINRLRVWIYILFTLIEEEENQKRGIIILLMQLGRIHPKDINADLARENPRIMKWIPLRYSGLHNCIEDPLLSTLSRINIVGSPPDIRAKHRLHVGSHAELLYKLLPYGIPVDIFPMNAQSRLKKANHGSWISRRQIKEVALEQEQKAEAEGVTSLGFKGIDLPSCQDVLIGKGKPIQEHIGNIKFRELVHDYIEEYNAAKRGDKAAVTAKVFEIVNASSGRFLAKDEDGWWNEVSPGEAHEKAYRTFIAAGTKLRQLQAAAAQGVTDHDKRSTNGGRSTAVKEDEYYEEGKNSSSVLSQPGNKRRKYGCCNY